MSPLALEGRPAVLRVDDDVSVAFGAVWSLPPAAAADLASDWAT